MYKSLPYDPVRDYDPVSLFISSGFVFAVNAALPVRNIEELVALARSQPGKLNYASTSPRGAAGIVGEWFNHVAGIRIAQIPYKTTAQAAQDTASGVTQMIIISLGVVAPFVQAGKIRVIGVNGGNSSINPRFLNKRAEMWKQGRDWLKEGGAIPQPTSLPKSPAKAVKNWI